MSHRIFSPNRFIPRNFNEMLHLWSEVFEERGGNATTIAFMQLILDKLMESCRTSSLQDCVIPEAIDLSTFNMETFIKNQLVDKDFDYDKQKIHDGFIAQFVAKLVQNLGESDWMIHVQEFLQILCRLRKTVFLATKTIMFFYFEVVTVCAEPNLEREFKRHLTDICRNLATHLSKENDERGALRISVTTFFEQISKRPQLIQQDGDGCARIISKFLTANDDTVNTDALNGIMEFCTKRVHGQRMLRLCAGERIALALGLLISDVKLVKLKMLAIKLACQMQELVRERNLFEMLVFRDCVQSDSEAIRDSLAKLCRLALRGPTRETADPVNVLLRATTFHQRFRQNYTDSPKHLTNTFFNEFTNWPAVFAAIQMRLNDQAFINELTQILRTVFAEICKPSYSEDMRRSYAHTAIAFMHRLDRQYVKTHDNIIFTLCISDNSLELVDNEHCTMLANTISEISTNFFTDHTQQTNVMIMFKKLLRKGFIDAGLLQAKVDEILNLQRNLAPQVIGHNDDFDLNSNILNGFMNICVFAGQELLGNESASVCKLANEIVKARYMDLTRNRQFLAYNIRTLVRTFVWIHKQRDQQTIQSIADITQDRILQYLFEIFEKTQDDFDFLCTEAFLSLGYMELHLKTVTHSTNTIVFAQYALKKISLVTVDRQRGVNHIQMDYLKYIVVSIMQMLENGTRIDVRDVVFHLHMRFPDYSLSNDLLKMCAKIPSMTNPAVAMLTDCVVKTLDGLLTKMKKEQYMVAVESILKTLPNGSVLRTQILKVEMDKLKAAGQQQRNASAEKQSQQIFDILKKVLIPSVINETV